MSAAHPLGAVVGRFVQNRGAVLGAFLLLVVLIMAATASLVFPQDPLRIVGPAQIWPFTNSRFPLGTDSLGRDIAAMIMHGSRTTLLIGLFASLTAMAIGVTVGAVSGFYGGLVAKILLRFTELFQIIPSLILVLTVVTIVGPELPHVIVAIGAVTWTPIARLTRAEFLSWRNRDFVAACRAMGMSDFGLIIGEILPNALTPVIALSTLVVAGAILFESGLSFLGLADPTVSTWGRLVGEGRGLIRTSWYICALPGSAILLTVFALNLIGDGLSEALNPRSRRR
jgi:peptide/nickel transport system permease protein